MQPAPLQVLGLLTVSAGVVCKPQLVLQHLLYLPCTCPSHYSLTCLAWRSTEKNRCSAAHQQQGMCMYCTRAACCRRSMVKSWLKETGPTVGVLHGGAADAGSCLHEQLRWLDYHRTRIRAGVGRVPAGNFDLDWPLGRGQGGLHSYASACITTSAQF